MGPAGSQGPVGSMGKPQCFDKLSDMFLPVVLSCVCCMTTDVWHNNYSVSRRVLGYK